MRRCAEAKVLANCAQQQQTWIQWKRSMSRIFIEARAFTLVATLNESNCFLICERLSVDVYWAAADNHRKKS